jgi:hypothetical protein
MRPALVILREAAKRPLLRKRKSPDFLNHRIPVAD